MILVITNTPENHPLSQRQRILFDSLPAKFIYRTGRIQNGLSILKEALKTKPKIVYASDTGYITSFGIILGKIAGSRCILETGDILYNLFKNKGRNLESYICYFAEPTFWKIPDDIVVRGILFKKYLEDRGYKNVHFIPDGVDTTVFKPMKKTKNKDTITLGSIGTSNWSEKYNFCYGWEVVEVIRILKEKNISCFKALLILSGNGVDILKERTKKYGIDKDVYFSSVDFGELPKYINLMDICFWTQTNDMVGAIRTTGKLPLYMACAKYIIATDVGTAQIFLPDPMRIRYDGVKDDRYPERVVQKLEEILKNREILNEGRKLRDLAKKHFDYKVLRKKIKEIVDKYI